MAVVRLQVICLVGEHQVFDMTDGDGLTVATVDCLAVCKRPCTVALVGADKWTYLIGDLDPCSHVDEIVAAAKSFAASENGIVPWRERPASFRKGVIARVPPINHKELQ